MYISEFWCGVGATVLVELVSLIGYGIYINREDKNNYN